MAEQSSGKAQTKTPAQKKLVTPIVATATTSTTPTASPVAPAPAPAPVTAPASLPEPSPRVGVSVNVNSVQRAFTTNDKARSITWIQAQLVARGFEPGNAVGRADYETRAAFARYQKSIDERATGLPTEYSLDYLGFDVVG